jgi:hypothetical protein
LRPHETTGNTSLLKIRLATPRWKKLAVRQDPLQNRFRITESNFDPIEHVTRNTKDRSLWAYRGGLKCDLGHALSRPAQPRFGPSLRAKHPIDASNAPRLEPSPPARNCTALCFGQSPPSATSVGCLARIGSVPRLHCCLCNPIAKLSTPCTCRALVDSTAECFFFAPFSSAQFPRTSRSHFCSLWQFSQSPPPSPQMPRAPTSGHNRKWRSLKRELPMASRSKAMAICARAPA